MPRLVPQGMRLAEVTHAKCIECGVLLTTAERRRMDDNDHAVGLCDKCHAEKNPEGGFIDYDALHELSICLLGIVVFVAACIVGIAVVVRWG